MSEIGSERRRTRARIAVITRDNPGSPELAGLRKEYAMLKIADAIQTVLEEGPGLDESHRARLIAMLGGSPGGR